MNIEPSLKHVNYILLAISAILFISIAYQSFGYDDEYYNVRLITDHTIFSLIKEVETSDVHPPLSYIINFMIFRLFNNWSIVRVFSAILFLGALAYMLSKQKGNATKLIIILFLGFNPTILLWATSIRWYAYAIPLLILLSTPPRNESKYYWFYFFIGFLILSYIGYIGIVLIAPYFVVYYLNDKNTFIHKLKRITIPAVIYLLLYGYQLYIFKTVHQYNNVADNQQTFDLKTSILSYISSVFSNQAVFPISMAGITSIIGTALLLLVMYKQVLINKVKSTTLLLFTLSSLLFVLTGVAGKLRNLVLLEVSKVTFISNGISNSYKYILALGFTLVFTANIYGIYNVYTHQRTTKNAWNLPLNESLTLMNKLAQADTKEVYFTHHPTYTNYLINKNLISFYSGLYFDSAKIKTSIQALNKDTLTPKMNFNFIVTYKGRSIDINHYSHLLQTMQKVQCDSIKKFELGFDSDYTLKRRSYPDYPKYTFVLYKYYGVKSDFSQLHEWEISKD